MDSFRERSQNALAPEATIAYRERRRREYPRQSGIYDDRERSAYHFERQATRGHEALTPGESRAIPSLRFIKHHKGGTRSERIGSFTKRVVHPETREAAWTIPTTYRERAYHVTPRAVTYTSSLSATEKHILTVLYDSADAWTFHVEGKFKVNGLPQTYFATCSGISQPQVSRIMRGLEEKGWLKIRREGDDASDPYVYYLASYENGAWTYPALHKRSGRARLQWYAGMSTTELDWHAALTEVVRQRRPKHPGIDGAERKLRRDQQRKRTAETGLHAASDLAGPDVDWQAEKEQAAREAADKRQQLKEQEAEAERREELRRRSGRDGPPGSASGGG